jgi:DNA-binding beta-propeller fold protein YncE
MGALILAGVLGLSVLSQAASAGRTAPAPPAGVSGVKATGPFHVERVFDVGGEGGWDLLAVDPEAHRLYVPRGNRVMVIDTDTGKTAGEIGDTAGVHGVALAPEFNRGFTSNGKAGTVTVFDLKSLKVLQTVAAGQGPDAILFDPATKSIVVFNGKSHDATVIRAEDGVVAGTIPIGGKPELGVADGTGKVYVNVEDTSEVVRLDPRALKVEKRFALSPGDGPSGLAFDPAHNRLFAVCSNEKMVVLDAGTGKILATPKIGKGVDGAAFDAVGGFAVSSNGDGTMSVVSAKGDAFEVVQTLATGTRARTVVIDPKSRRMYLPTAEFEAAKDLPKDAPKTARRPRPAMKPGTFRILVVAP